MNKRLVILTLGAALHSSTALCTPNYLHQKEKAWATPVKVDHDVHVHADTVALAPDEPQNIVTIKQVKKRLWMIHGEKPGTVTLMIKRSKKGKAVAHPYHVVEPKV